MKIFRTEFEVYFEDISPSGKIHLEKLAEWMSMARERYFRTTCSNHLEFIEGPVQMFTSNLSITINGTSRWADAIEVSLTSSNIKKISFEITADFKNKRTGEIIASGTQKVVFINTNSHKFTDIPEDLKNNVIQYLR